MKCCSLHVRLVSVSALVGVMACVTHAAEVSYQEGDGGLYSETDATWIEERDPLENQNESDALQLELEYRSSTNLIFRSLVGFFEVFGDGPSQIPLGSTINSASLTLTPTIATNSGGGSAEIMVHRMLTAWEEETVAWATFDDSGLSDKGNAGGGAPGVDYIAEPLDMQTAADGTGVEPGDPSVFDVTSAVQDWSDGFANNGFMLTFESSNGVFFYADNAGDLSLRPLLEVDFEGGVGIVDGDVDGDGDVDEFDYEVIRDNMFETVTLRNEGDLVRDGIVNFSDFREWKNNATPATLAGIDFSGLVPEPSAALLALTMSTLCAAAGRKRRRG